MFTAKDRNGARQYRLAGDQDWAAAVRDVAHGKWWAGTASIIPFGIVLVLAVHVCATFYTDYHAEDNLRALDLAQKWRPICENPTQVRDLGVYAACADHLGWLRQPFALNILRRSLLSHVTHWSIAWSTIFGWMTTWDPFYEFHCKLMVNSIFSSLSTAIPFLTILVVVYAFLMLRFPIASFRNSMVLTTGKYHQIPSFASLHDSTSGLPMLTDAQYAQLLGAITTQLQSKGLMLENPHGSSKRCARLL